jgi:Flp pilus assembly protein CpaB
VADGPATSALVQPGDRVDILAAGDPQDAGAALTATVVHGVRVLAVPGAGEPSGGSADDTGGLLVVAATAAQADALAGAATGARLSVAVRADAG